MFEIALFEGMNNMLVKARPLSKLCEYKGGDLPEGYKSDCYGNVDETVYACKEKRRIMVWKLKFLFLSYLSIQKLLYPFSQHKIASLSTYMSTKDS